jgi:hypothetical protein
MKAARIAQASGLLVEDEVEDGHARLPAAASQSSPALSEFQE